MFAAESAGRYPSVKTVSMHPGLIRTQSCRPSSSFVLDIALGFIQSLMFMDVPNRARNQLWAAAGSKQEDVKDGPHYTPVDLNNKSANDEKAGKTLWEWTESRLAKAG